MGYALLFESMLDTVLYARKNWLKPGGKLLPDLAHMYLAMASPDAAHADLKFWETVYGFNMRCVQNRLQATLPKEAIVQKVSKDCIISEPSTLVKLDLNTVWNTALSCPILLYEYIQNFSTTANLHRF